MGITTNHVSVDELNRLHEKLASAFRVAGLKGDQLDAAIAAALTPSLQEIETDRKAKADRRSRVRLVTD